MYKKQIGFTLVELVTVIILLGILAVNVLPRFTGSSDFEVHPYRIQMIAALRLAQQRAMHQTDLNQDNGICHQILIASEIFGTPDRTDCSITNFDNWVPDGVSVVSDGAVSFSLVNNNITIVDAIINFDNMGRPSSASNCNGGCTIVITNNENSDDELGIAIESEGFIHAL